MTKLIARYHNETGNRHIRGISISLYSDNRVSITEYSEDDNWQGTYESETTWTTFDKLSESTKSQLIYE